MTTDGSLFASAIEHHLELKRRNQHLDDDLPLDEFIGDDPFANHPLFKTEAEARARGGGDRRAPRRRPGTSRRPTP